jgi:hypothetical protein
VEAAGLYIEQTVLLRSDQRTPLKEQRGSRPLTVQMEASQKRQMEGLHDQGRAASSAKASGGQQTSPLSSLEAGLTTLPKTQA